MKSLVDIYSKCNLAVIELVNYEEASKFGGWRAAIQKEIKMIQKNENWKIVNRPLDKYVTSVKWIYKTKLNVDGYINKLKARLVVKGYAQKNGEDCFQTFAQLQGLILLNFLLHWLLKKVGFFINQMLSQLFSIVT